MPSLRGAAPAVPPPTLTLQINALQAMCRQVFGFRLAMIAIGAPFALAGAAHGAPGLLVGAAVLVTFMGSYVLFRDWERFGPLLLNHPWLLAVDAVFGALLLITATPESPLGYVTICTPLLAGLVYGWRGAGVFAGLQVAILTLVYATGPRHQLDDASALLLPGFCVIVGAIGVTIRNLLFRFGAASQALTETRARLAVHDAVEEERARLARDMHDSVAKTLHGLALAADGLAASADRMDPAAVRDKAALVARAARRAAAESRELLGDLRRTRGEVDLLPELASLVRDFAERTGLRTEWAVLGAGPSPTLPAGAARQLLTIASEALDNAHRHAGPARVEVTAEVEVAAGVAGGGAVFRLRVQDDGPGLPAGTTLDALKRTGHFGLVGMVERAAAMGARIRIGRGAAPTGTEVRVELPLPARHEPSGPMP
ncbi:sensor histidine kinase [Streptomyces sp. NBC_00083]|uniref:sensor histidine kinase n=1 Tax=Streptomyces sp. NBC_00083 TaxID=2975647 RepID=UPI00224CD271|nr:histidine kinase [Streptomyces sp. NBC_00083]MCX5385319.1 histidine kinase [Streptomyces sp. NBC_00083]